MRRKHVLANDGEVVGVSYRDEKRIGRELPSCMDSATIEMHIKRLRELGYIALPQDFKYFSENPKSIAYMRRVSVQEAKYGKVNPEEHLIIALRLRANDLIGLATNFLTYEQVAAAEERRHIVVMAIPIYAGCPELELSLDSERRECMGDLEYEAALKIMALGRHESPHGFPSACEMDLLCGVIGDLTHTNWLQRSEL